MFGFNGCLDLFPVVAYCTFDFVIMTTKAPIGGCTAFIIGSVKGDNPNVSI